MDPDQFLAHHRALHTRRRSMFWFYSALVVAVLLGLAMLLMVRA